MQACCCGIERMGKGLVGALVEPVPLHRRSIDNEEVHLRAYSSVAEARASIGRSLGFHNGRRPRSSLDRQTPDQAYSTRTSRSAAA